LRLHPRQTRKPISPSRQLHSRTFTALVTLTLSGAASAAQVWTAPASSKVRPLTAVPAQAPASVAIAAARNEFEGFQVVVTGAASAVSMSMAAGLSDGSGHTISGNDVVLYRAALINITTQSGGDGATGWWPDALIPDVDPLVGEKRNAFPFDVPAGENRVVYVDVHVPADAPAGTYTGKVSVTGGVTAQVPVTLTVWDFAIPSTTTLQSAFGITWNGPCMGHGDGSCSNTAYERDLRARYVQSALDNRVGVSIPDTSVPVAADGTANWATFDDYAGRFLNGTVSSMRLKGAKLTAVQIYGSGSAAAVKSWSDHFKANGWSSTIFNYICDEPPATCAWSDIPTRIAASRAGDPALTTLVTTQPYTAAANGVTGIDRYVAVINFLEGKPGTSLAGNQRASWPANIWSYQGCMSFGCGGGTETGWPSYAIDTDATRNRAMEWMSYTFDTTGELYYEMTMAYFSGDPWVEQQDFGGNGDGTLFYPGTVAKIGGATEIPIESLRLKGIRDGMEDYELLHLATTLGLGAQAKQIALAVYPHAYQGVTTPAALDTARAQLAALILHALGKDTTPVTDPCATTSCTAPTPSPVTTPTPGAATATTSVAGCSTAGGPSLWFAAAALAIVGLRRRPLRNTRKQRT
jgi:hypothetical protein